jgi:2,3-bisphosphoglycerate-dependent phosphoglycerate mutase
MTIILLVRHAETDWNRERRWQGHAPTSLNEAGRKQAVELAERLVDAELEAIYSSDLPRALQTAEIVAAKLDLRVVPEPALREIDVGSWEGRTRSELEGLQWDGETYDAHRERVFAAVRAIADRHPSGKVLAVTHGGSLRRLQEVALGQPLDVLENCAVWELVIEDGRIRAID